MCSVPNAPGELGIQVTLGSSHLQVESSGHEEGRVEGEYMVRLHKGHRLSYNSLSALSESEVICRTWGRNWLCPINGTRAQPPPPTGAGRSPEELQNPLAPGSEPTQGRLSELTAAPRIHASQLP